MNSTAPDLLASSPDNDTGLAEAFFGQHMTNAELDAEFLARIEPSRLKDLAAFTEMAWYGYRFMHPGLRVFLFIHEYTKAYRKTARIMGKRWAMPKFMRANPLEGARKGEVTGFVTATLSADAHGLPYDFWCETMMEVSLRGQRDRPPQPAHMYNERLINAVLDKWKERNEAGIFLAKAPQLLAINYDGHPWQDAYQHHLCEQVTGKGNRPFWLSRLIYSTGQLRAQHAVERFGEEMVNEADYYK